MATPTKPMCCVAIGYKTLLMPADKGMKLVELLQYAVECERRYASHEAYAVGEHPRVELIMVKPGQIQMPEGVVESMPARSGRGRRLLK